MAEGNTLEKETAMSCYHPVTKIKTVIGNNIYKCLEGTILLKPITERKNLSLVFYALQFFEKSSYLRSPSASLFILFPPLFIAVMNTSAKKLSKLNVLFYKHSQYYFFAHRPLSPKHCYQPIQTLPLWKNSMSFY